MKKEKGCVWARSEVGTSQGKKGVCRERAEVWKGGGEMSVPEKELTCGSDNSESHVKVKG